MSQRYNVFTMPQKLLIHAGNSYKVLPETVMFHSKWVYCPLKTFISTFKTNTSGVKFKERVTKQT